ncbi:hypothetical protein [Vibrio crassostreae]|uniref:hypothetical protein n=1 Tax=Vibrio crassostreae TaxID=246167 RepID=UPI0010502BC0|nr:hypothetical protein [Vibrio crassostreae]TCT60143.1 hypothetical protein EDB31_15411 [Vibrio crassostreae]
MLPLIMLAMGSIGGGALAWKATTETAAEVADALAPDGALVNVGNQHNTQPSPSSSWVVWVLVLGLALWVWKGRKT